MILQDEADRLIASEKRFVDAGAFIYLPEPGSRRTIPLESVDGSESFFLDVRRGLPEQGDSPFDKWTLQLRYGDDVLFRLDTAGPSHRNPEDALNRRLSSHAGRVVPTPHVQSYVEGAERPWAFPPPSEFTALDDIIVTWREFLAYCNVIETPDAIGGF